METFPREGEFESPAEEQKDSHDVDIHVHVVSIPQSDRIYRISSVGPGWGTENFSRQIRTAHLWRQ